MGKSDGLTHDAVKTEPENGKVPPRRVAYRLRRPRERLSEDEIVRLIEAARAEGRHRNRDASLILLMFRHGLRVSEAIALQWRQVDLAKGVLQVERVNNGVPSTHRLLEIEIRALRLLQRDYPDTPYVFVSERRAQLSTAAVRKIVARAGQQAGIGFPVHPHQLRHAIGYVLSQAGTDPETLRRYLGHKKMEHTTRYSALLASATTAVPED